MCTKVREDLICVRADVSVGPLTFPHVQEMVATAPAITSMLQEREQVYHACLTLFIMLLSQGNFKRVWGRRGKKKGFSASIVRDSKVEESWK